LNRDLSTPGAEVVVERTIAALPAAVWRIVGDPEGMRRWLGMLNYQPRVGGRVLLDQTAGATEDAPRLIVYGRVTAYVPESEVTFTWCGFMESRSFWPADTLVSITLVPEGDATVVRLTHSGFAALGGPEAQAFYRAYHHCWVQSGYMQRLDDYSGASA
jgi:uncharacterized protein YndB with AHSA1/START domain